MKLQLDTTQKVIRLEEEVNLSDLFETLEKLLPNGLWKEFKLQQVVITSWVNPIVIDRWPTIPFPSPYQPPWYVTCSTTNMHTIDSGNSNYKLSN